MNISIFAKRAFLNVNASQEFEYKGITPKNGHLMRVSSMIRADQIAQALGAKLNPLDDFKDDLCIYIKPHAKADEDFDFAKHSYLDIVDGWGLLPLLRKHPEVGVIACSKQDFDILSNVLPDHKVVFIPQHHCNFERAKRNRKEVKTVGIIGTDDAFAFIPTELKEGLEKRGIKLIEFSKFFTREDVVSFYKSIDIQLVWRPYRMRLSNPLKIVNASSFGIPTIAYRESVFDEVSDCCIQVESWKDFLSELNVLKMYPDLYKQHSKDCLEKAEEYHIENVADLYRSLI